MDPYTTTSINEVGLCLLNGLQPTGRSVGPNGRVFLTFDPAAKALIDAYNAQRDLAAELLGAKTGGAR